MSLKSGFNEVIGYSNAPFCIPEEDLVSPPVKSNFMVDSQLGVAQTSSSKPMVAQSSSSLLLDNTNDVLASDLGVPVRSERSVEREVHAKAPWASLFKDNRKDGLKLCKMQTETEGPVFVEEEFEGEKEWELCLIGCVGGAFPGMGALKNITRNWKGRHKVQIHDSGWIVFQFDDLEDMLKVLLDGPYFINGKPLLLKRMPKYFCFGHEDMHVVPIWVRLINLPLILWKDRFLSKIASYLGNPLSTDLITAKKRYLQLCKSSN